MAAWFPLAPPKWYAARPPSTRGTLTPIRIDGRVQIDPKEIDALIAQAKLHAELDKN
jgi:hypothetical protein